MQRDRSPVLFSVFAMQKKADPYYKTKRWQRLRRYVLLRDGYQCQVFKREGMTVPADTVHHIFPREQYPEYKWENWNLISVSASAHDMLHDRSTGGLTRMGEELRRATAREQGLDEIRVTLIIGNPGTGKTTYAREHMGNAIVYDLDALAAAFRLTSPKAERFKPARWLANSLLPGFVEAARNYVSDIMVIRTAPTLEEFERIDPTKLVVIRGGYGNDDLTQVRRTQLARRTEQCVQQARSLGIVIEEVDRQEGVIL